MRFPFGQDYKQEKILCLKNRKTLYGTVRLRKQRCDDLA